jgi:DNA-binding NtrC family response regulator
MPRLRDRPEAIRKIAHRMIARYAEMMGSPVRSVHPSAMFLLKNYQWPGNFEELERTIALAVSRAAGSILLPDDLPFSTKTRSGEGIENLSLEEAISIKLSPLVDTIEDLPEGELYKLVLSKLERPLFKLVLDKLSGNKVKAANVLGLHRNTLRKKLKELGLSSKIPRSK